MTDDFTIRVGDSKQWIAFAERNQSFMNHIDELFSLTKAVIIREFEASPLDRAIYASGELAVDSFWEIFILAANGYGFGARGILRTMFERVVVSKWLAENPGDLNAFLDFYWVVQWKYANAIQTTLGKVFTDEQMAKIRERRDAVYGQFPTIECDECGAKGPVITWSQYDMVAMAKKVGMGALLFECYYESTLTGSSLRTRADESHGTRIGRGER